MLKVKNKQTIVEITRTSYKAHKKRNILTILAIALTTFLIAVIIAVGASYFDTIMERQVRMNGMDYDIELSEPREEQVEIIRAMDKVKLAGLAVKCAVLEQYEDVMLDKTRLYWLDETCWEQQTIPALEKYTGTYPRHENEIMLSAGALKAMGIREPETGMILPVKYYTLLENGNEQILEEDFVLCGWFKDYTGQNRGYVSYDFYRNSGVKQTDLTQGVLKITLNNSLYSEEDIIEMQKAIDMGKMQFINADTDTIASFIKIIIGLAVMLIMVFASGYLFIFNTLYISISKDIRYYGQLKTLGMTSVQLKSVVYRQAVWNSLLGIPIGMAAAVITSQMVVPRVLSIINTTLSDGSISQVPKWVYYIAVAFAFITNMLSSRKPARMVGDCSPIEAMRYVPGTAKKKKRVAEGGSLPSMAWQNMFRDKKQAVVILLSFVIAVSMFLIINVVIRQNDARRILNESYTFDLLYKNETTLEEQKENIITDRKVSDLEGIDGVQEVRRVTSTQAVIPFQEDVFGTYYKELYESRFSPGNYEEDIALYKENETQANQTIFDTRFIGIDKKGFQLLNMQLGNVLDWEKFEKGETAVATKTFTEGDNGITGKTVRFLLPQGLEPEEEHSIQIAAVAMEQYNPAYFAGGYNPTLIVSEDYAQKLLGDTFTELVHITYKEPFSSNIENEVKGVFADNKKISYESKLDRYKEMKNSETQVKVLGGSIGFIMAMLAVLNYFNMIAAGIQNRSTEFAILESIGMTSKQTQKMLILEGAGYAVISLAASMCIGIPISYLVFDNLNIYGIPYSFAWMNNIVLFIVIIIVCIGTPIILYRETQKISIIERLRKNDN